jgi:formylglycine-generating enzyme required for sulfatase activity
MFLGRVGIFMMILLASLSAHAQTTCESVFISHESVAATIENLAHLRVALDIAWAQSPRSPVTARLHSDFQNKEANLVRYFETHNLMSRSEFFSRLRKAVERVQSNQIANKKDSQEKKETQRKNIANLVPMGMVMDFNDVSPGTFYMGSDPAHLQKTIITRAYQMAATVTTVVVWKKVADIANQRLSTKFKLNVNQISVDFYPIEGQSFNEVQNWLKSLNELARLGDPIVAEVMPGHKKGDLYRLPTSAEWEFIERNLGAREQLDFRGTEWTNANSDEVQPVALLKPVIVSGHEYYDLHGNVRQWVADARSEGPPAEVDPFSAGDERSSRAIRGSNYMIASVPPGYLEYTRPHPHYSGIGFRIVRVRAEN